MNFGNDTNNALDTGFGYANAALGVFTQYLQASKFIEGNMLYNNTEFYVQDNWKVTSRLTLDYGMRFMHQQPQYDQFNQMSNFFPDKWKASDAPVLLRRRVQQRRGGLFGQHPQRDGSAHRADPHGGGRGEHAGGHRHADSRHRQSAERHHPGGQRHREDELHLADSWWSAPRFGFAYDLTGKSDWVIRGGGGLFYDRPDGNTVFSIPGNPPIATANDLRNGSLPTLGQGLSPQPVPALVTFQYNAQVPSSLQWQAGFQKALPFAMVGDVSYVGNHGYNRLGSFQGGTQQPINAVDFGAAYLPQNQDPTLGAATYPGQTAYTTNLLRPYLGFNTIGQNTTRFYDTYHSIQMTLNRRFGRGFSFGANYTYGISLKGCERHADQRRAVLVRRRGLERRDRCDGAPADAAGRDGGRHRLGRIQGKPRSRRRCLRIPGRRPGKPQPLRAGLLSQPDLFVADLGRRLIGRLLCIRRAGAGAAQHLCRSTDLRFLPQPRFAETAVQDPTPRPGSSAHQEPRQSVAQSAGRRRSSLPGRACTGLYFADSRRGIGDAAEGGP